MEKRLKSNYLWVLGPKVCLEGMETVYRFVGITFGHKISITPNGRKSCYIPSKVPAVPKLTGRISTTAFCYPPLPFLYK